MQEKALQQRAASVATDGKNSKQNKENKENGENEEKEENQKSRANQESEERHGTDEGLSDSVGIKDVPPQQRNTPREKKGVAGEGTKALKTSRLAQVSPMFE